MEVAEQRGVIYDTEVNVQSAINLMFVLPPKVSARQDERVFILQ